MITLIGGAKVAFGRDVQPDGFGHRRWKIRCEGVRSDVFVAFVDALGRGAKITGANQMTDIMHQRRGDQAVGGAGLLGKQGALQGMRQLSDRLVAILATTGVGQGFKDVIDDHGARSKSDFRPLWPGID